MKQIFSRVLLLILITAAILGLSSCTIFFEQEEDIYRFDSSRFDREVVFGEELDLDSLSIEVFGSDGVKKKTLTVTESMVIKGDTDTIGDHELVIEYGGERWTVMYTVFYEIKFTVPDDQTQSSTQLVSSVDEIIMPDDPAISGSTFIGWSKKIPAELTGNMELFAIFADRITIPKFEATYGDKLSSLDLPEVNDAKWEWVDDPDTTFVGNATEGRSPNSFQILYIPNNDELDPIEFTTTVSVKKKTLTFTLPTSVEYDPDAQKYNFLGMYTLTGFVAGEEDYKPRVILLGDNNVSEIGKYSYTLGVADSNYRGDYVGYFEITPIKLTIDVIWKSGKDVETIIYGGQLPEYEYKVMDKDGNEYTEFLSSDLKVTVHTPVLEVGTYYLTATLSDEVADDIDYTKYYSVNVNYAKLVVESKVMNPGDPKLAEEYVIYFGDTLSEIQFAYHPNGSWAWVDDPSTAVGNVGTNRFKAQFTPFSDNYDAPEPVWISLTVLPKELSFRITSPTRVVYDGQPHNLTYEIIDLETGEKFDKELVVLGNDSYIDASATPYGVTLVFEDTNYLAKNNSFNITIDKASPEIASPSISGTWKPGMKVSDLDISGVENDGLAGVFTWNNGGQPVDMPGNYEYYATFTPSDFKNYSPVRVKVLASVDKATPKFESNVTEYTGLRFNDGNYVLKNVISTTSDNSKGNVKFLLSDGTEITYLKNAGTYTVTVIVEADKEGYYKEIRKTVTVTIDKVDPVISLDIDNWTYGSAAKQPVADCNAIGNYEIGIAGYEYRFVGSSEWIDFTSASYPTKAGKYELRALVSEGANHNSGISETVTFTIDKQVVTVPTIASMTYNKGVQYPDVSSTALYTVAAKGTAGNMGGQDVNKYYVTLTLVDGDNYKWPGTESLTYEASYDITKALVNAIADFNGGEWTYNGTAQVDHSTTSDFGEVKYTYYYVSGSNRILVEKDDIVNAGNYLVVASVAGNNNYVAATSVEKSFTIKKAVVSRPVLNSDSFEFNGQLIKPTIVDNNATNKTLYYVSRNTGNTNVGENYEVILTIDASKFDNYRWEGQADDQRTLTLTYDITQAVVNIDSASQSDWTYLDSTILPVIKINKSFSVNYKYEYRLVGTENWTEIAPSDSGNYEVRITVLDDASGNANYVGGDNKSKVLTFTINPKSYDLDVTVNGGIYNKTDLTSGLSGVAGIYTVTDSGDAVTVAGKGTPAGTYTVTFTLVKTDDGVYNYVWGTLPAGAVKSSDGTTVTISYTIEQKSVAKPTFITNSFTYDLVNGAAKDYEVTAAQLNNFNSEYMTITCGKQNQAGNNYTATITLDSNYKWNDGDTSRTATVIWSINKAKAEIVVDTTTITKVFGQTVTLPTATTKFGTVECDTVASSLVNKGTYTVTYTVAGTDNYDGDTKTVTVIIDKATVTVSGISINGWTYGLYNSASNKPKFTSAKTNTGVDVSGYVTFEYSESGVDGWTTDVPENAGTYYLRAKVSASEHGNWDETYVNASETFKIAKQDVPVPVIESLVYSGATMYPEISNTDLYTVAIKGTDGNKGGINVGTYYVTLTLTDTAFANYKWAGSEEKSIDASYTITKAVPVINPGFTSANASKEYDGASLNLATSATAGSTVIPVNYIKIRYYEHIKNANGEYYYNEIVAPKNVGTYYVKVTVSAETNSNWSAHETGYIEYKISPKKIDPVVFMGDSIYYFDNTLKAPSVSTSGYYTIKWYTVVNGELGADITNTLNTASVSVGKYIVVVSLNNPNYVWRENAESNESKTFEYEIKQNTVSVTDIIFKNGEITLPNTWVFGTNVTVDQTVNKTFDDVTFTYKYEYKLSSEGDDKYVEWTEASYPKNVGEYSIRVTVNGNENYVGVSRVETVTITQATETPTVSTPEDFASKPGNPEFVQGDSENNDKLVLDYIPGNTAFNVEEYLTVTLDTDNVVESNREIDRIVITKKSSAYSLRAATVTGTLDSVGEYTVTYYFKTNDNYTDASVTITVIIEAKSIADVIEGETTKPTVNVNFDYNSTVFNNDFQTQSISITTVEGAVSLVEGTDFTWTIRNSNGDVVNADEIKHADTYTVTIEGMGNYTGSVVRTFTVTKKQVSISTVIDTVNLVEYKKDTKYSLKDLINPSIAEVADAIFEYYVDGSNSASTHLENAGTFSVKVVLVHDDYKADVTVSLTVKKNTSDTGTPSNMPATYGDKLFSVVGALPDHTEYGTWSWENADENTTVGPAGENTFYAVFTPHAQYAGNYDSRRVPVIITVSKSGNVTIDTNVNNSQQYNGEAGYEIKDLINPSVDGIENETFTYYLVESIDGVNVETTVTKLTDAKTYRIKVVLVHANFEAETYVDVTINPNTTATGTVNVKNEATFLDKLSSLGSLPTSVYGTWAWADADKNPVDPALVTVGNATTAGEHNIFYAIFTPYPQYESNYAKREVKIEVSVGKYEITKPDDITENYTGSDVISSHFKSHEYYSLFDVTYENNERVNVGEYTATLTLKNDAFKNYKWKNTDAQSVTVSYKISESAIQWTITGLDGWTFGDSVDEFTVVAKYGETIFGYKVEYKLSTEGDEKYTEWTDSSYPDKAGAYTIRFTAIADDIGSYENASVTREITVSPRSISGATVNLNKDWETYTGNNLASSISVNSVKLVVNGAEKPLVEGTDYTVSIPKTITNVGEYTITVTGKGNYSGTVSETFTVKVRELSTPSVTGGFSFVFNTEAQHPTIEPSDYYIIKWYKNVDGNYEEITSDLENSSIGVGNYVAVVTLNDTHNATHTNIKWATDATTSFEYSITHKNIEDKTGEEFDITISHTYSGLIYTGNPVTDRTVTVKWGDIELGSADCDITIKNEKGETTVLNAGTYTITVTGKGNYKGTRSEVTFTVDEKPISGATVTLNSSSATYANTDFYSELVASVTGVNIGTLTVTYGNVIVATDTAGANPVTEVKNAGTYYVIVTGTGNFEGTAYATFEVEVRTVEAPEVEIPTVNVNDSSVSGYIYSESSQYPTVTTSEYYTIKWYRINGDNSLTEITADLANGSKNVGNYKIVIELNNAANQHGNNIEWAANQTTEFEYSIVAKSIADATVTLGSSSAEYTGNDRTPTITVTLNGKEITVTSDYTVTIKNSSDETVEEIVDAGTYTIIVTGTGNYTGSVTRTFEVAKANAQIFDAITEADMPGKTYDGKSAYDAVLPAGSVYFIKDGVKGSNTGLKPTVTVYYEPYVGTANYLTAGADGKYAMTNAGTYTITYSFANDNFNTVESKTVIVTIGQATESLGTWLNATNTNTNKTYGDTLPTLPESDNGTWTWKSPATGETLVGDVTGDAYRTFYAEFAPKEGYENNYATLTGDKAVAVNINVAKATPDVNVTVSDKTYDGNAASVSVTVKLTNNSNITISDYTVYYYVKSGESYVLYGTDGKTAPTDVGDYAIRVVVEQSTRWNGHHYNSDNSIPDVIVDESEYDATFSITKKSITDKTDGTNFDVTIDHTYSNGDNDLVYTGSEFTGDDYKVIVKWGENITLDGDDCTITIAKGDETKVLNAGIYTITVIGKGNYEGERTVEFEVDVREITAPTFTGGNRFVFNGLSQSPTVNHTTGNDGYYTVKWYKVETVDGVEKETEVSKEDIINVGNYKIAVTLDTATHGDNIKWADGSVTSYDYEITPMDISDIVDGENTTPVVNVVFGNSLTYNGGNQTQTVVVTWQRGENTVTLNANNVTDYTWTIKDPNGNTVAANEIEIAGTYTVVITGTGNYKGSVERTFEVTKKSISGATVTLNSNSETYEKDTDFYSSIIADGNITVTVDGLTATYSVIVATDAAGTNPVTEVKNAGTYYVIVTGTGNFEGTSYAIFVVEQATVNLDHITEINKTYSDSSQKSGLESGTGYKVTDIGGKNVGEYTVTFELESDNYKWGTIPSYITDSDDDGIYSMTYNIVAKSLSDADIKIEHTYKNGNENLVYANSAFSGTVTVKWGENITLDEGENKDYILTITGVDNAGNYVTVVQNAGIYTITITAVENGNYTGTAYATFVVEKQKVNIVKVDNGFDYQYTGSEQNLVLQNSGLFDATKASNMTGTIIGTYTVRDLALADDTNYEWGGAHSGVTDVAIEDGKASFKWSIAQKDIASATVNYTIGSTTYTGSEITLNVTGATLTGYSSIDLERDNQGNIKVVIKRNGTVVGAVKEAGSYTITVTGSGNFTGTASATFTVSPADTVFSVGADIEEDYNPSTTYNPLSYVNLYYKDTTTSAATLTSANYTVKYVNTSGAVTENYTGTIQAAGTYTITYSFTATNNLNAPSGDKVLVITIKKVDPTVEGDGVTLTPNYGETGYNTIPTVTVNGTPITPTVAYVNTNGVAGTATSIVNAGTYTFTYRYAGDNNYNAGTYTTKVIVNKAIAHIIVDGNYFDPYYQVSAINLQNLIGATANTESDGTGSVVTGIKYYTTDNGTEEATIVDAGTYAIYIGLVNDNYKLDISKETGKEMRANVTVAVRQATPVLGFTETDFNKLYYKNRLGDSDYDNPVLTAKVNGIDIPGTWTYSVTFNKDNPEQSTGTATFTPLEAYKENVAGGSITFDGRTENRVYYPYIKLKVAATLNGPTGEKFGTIEEALEGRASGTIWVVPDTSGDLVIKGNESGELYINNGVTLLLPYMDSNGTITKNSSAEATLSGTTYGSVNKLVNTTLVRVAENVIITVNGYLEIAGQLSGGNGGTDYAGHTAGYYAELQLGRNAQIVVNNASSTIKAYGFITEETQDNDSGVTLNDGILYQPFTLRDFGGGSYMSTFVDNQKYFGIYEVGQNIISNHNISPFNEFQFINIHSDLTIGYNAEMIAWANLYAGGQQNDAEVKIVGNTTAHLLQLTTTNSRLEGKYDKTNGVMDIDLFGGANLNSMAITISIVDLGSLSPTESFSTEKVFFPISWSYDISLNDGDYVSNSRIQIMPGAKFEIGTGASLTCNYAIYVHKNMDTISVGPHNIVEYGDETSTEMLNGEGFNLAARTDPAVFIVNGKLTVHTLAGEVQATSAGGRVTITNTVGYAISKVSAYASKNSTVTTTANLGVTLTPAGGETFTVGTTTTYWFNGTYWTNAPSVNITYNKVDLNDSNNNSTGNSIYNKNLSDITGYFSGEMITLPGDTEIANLIGWYLKAADGKYIDANRIFDTEVSLEWLLSNLTPNADGSFTIYCVVATPYYDFAFDYGTQGDEYDVADETVRYAQHQLGYNTFRWASEFDFDVTKEYYHSGWIVKVNGTVVAEITRSSATQSIYLNTIVNSIPENATITLEAIWTAKKEVIINYGADVLNLEDDIIYLNLDFGQNTYELEDVTAGDMDYEASKYFVSWVTENCSVSGTTLTVTGNASVTATWANKLTVTINYGSNGLGFANMTNIYLNVGRGQTTYTIPDVYAGDLDYSVPKYYSGYETSNATWNAETRELKVTDTTQEVQIAFSWGDKVVLTINYGADNAFGLPQVKKIYVNVSAGQTSYVNEDYLAGNSNPELPKYVSGWTFNSGSCDTNMTDGTFSNITGNVEVTADWGDKIVVNMNYAPDDGTPSSEAIKELVDKTIYIVPNGSVTFAVDSTVLAALDDDNNTTSYKYYYDGEWLGTNCTAVIDSNGYITVTLNQNATSATVSPWNSKTTISVVVITDDNANGGREDNTAEYIIHIRYPNGGKEYATITKTYGNYEKGTENYYIVPGHEYVFDVTKYQLYSDTMPTDKSNWAVANTNASYTITANPKGCFAAGALVTLADGTVKKIEDVLPTDILVVFDHETGKFVEAEIMLIETHGGWDYYDIINVTFSNGITTRIINEHGFFNKTLNKYVYITEYNYTEFIGHEFIVTDGETISTTTLVDVTITNEYTGIYNIVTKYHLNCITDGLLSMSGGIDGIFNIFEYGEDLKYDEEKMQADIEKYGLYTYEDFAEYVSVDVYNMFPAQYFKVAVGKGHITYEGILALVEEYLVKHGYVNPDSFQ